MRNISLHVNYPKKRHLGHVTRYIVRERYWPQVPEDASLSYIAGLRGAVQTWEVSITA